MRSRLPAARSRPLLVLAWAALLGDDGLLGEPARRRAGRAALRALPALAAVMTAALLVARPLAAAPLGRAHAAAGLLLAGALAGVLVRRLRRGRAGRRLDAREALELGALVLLAAAALTRAAEAGGLPRDAALQPLVYLAVAALSASLPRGPGLALVAGALALEAGGWWGQGGVAADLPRLAARGGFIALFALLYHGVLGARIAAGRRAEAAAMERRRRELDERARQLRLLAVSGEAAEGGRAERAERLGEAAVLETDGAARGLLDVAGAALRATAAGAYLLSDDDRELRLWEGRAGSRLARVLAAGEGPLGGVVKRRAAVRMHGELRGLRHREGGPAPRALLAVPLLSRVGGHLRGVVLADRDEAVPFDEADERLLEAVAAELARAAAAERLIRDGRARREEQERFYGAIERLNRVTTPRQVLDAVLAAAADMVTVDFGAVTLQDDGTGSIRHKVARAVLAGGATAAELEGKEFADNGGLVACAVRLGSSLPGKALRLSEAIVFDEETRLRGLSSLKILPLRTGDAVLGTLVVGAHRPLAYDGDAVRQLEILGLQAGDALQRARLFEATERLATTDGLTGLVNHRTFQARLDEHLAAAQRYGKKLSLLLTDIDHFKSVNDTWGHPVGDLVLKGVARILQKEARVTDVAARYGGEEFALVMPETDQAGALRTAERIREKVAGARFRTEQGELSVTISIGVATFPGDGRQKAELVELADGGLYHAKRHGRNQTVALGQLRAARRA
ncbi:sensor domain-containing diguanylate cyclase [Anaeromyxobacter diazotrophicus]|nr:diguanylate cyclase [Anaeromyxobacter diazotrophicus]